MITHLDVVTSTSDHLREALAANAPEGTAFRANVQTKGRGRQGRDWQSPAGNLYVSILLKPQRPMAEWPSLSLITALALRDAMMTFRAADDLALKWPNDLLYRGDKCAGLLLEVEDGAILLGCGVNLDAEPVAVDGWQAGSLNRDPDLPNVSAAALMAELETRLVARYNRWNRSGFAEQLDDWHDAAAHLGQTLKIDLGAGAPLVGQFTTLNPDGSLCLRTADGVDHMITAGEVMRARLAPSPAIAITRR
ncbi:MAG: biotin--[acetyl-CoA-carboxylase] ligase [Alphaproteobacteria bacterium]|nr:biotin--[acetyl-CoA-carboxylase] ligase [Alphaproteobacteria bacterium]